MATKARTAKGVSLSVKISAAWKKFQEVSSVPEIGETSEKIDVTHLDSEMKEYIPDIPDWSSDLEFTMNAQPADEEDGNMALVLSLDKDTVYEWKVEYPQIGKEATFTGRATFRMGGAEVSAKQDLIVTVIPNSGLVWSDISVMAMLSYDDQQETGVGA